MAQMSHIRIGDGSARRRGAGPWALQPQAGLGDPYLPFREILHALSGDVEHQRAGGAITPEHARRLWMLLPGGPDPKGFPKPLGSSGTRQVPNPSRGTNTSPVVRL